jgi:RNA recognition motif-containing protein
VPGAPAQRPKSKGCAFLEFTHRNALQQGLKLHQSMLDGRMINVELTAGGGGKSESRLTKVRERNKALLGQRVSFLRRMPPLWFHRFHFFRRSASRKRHQQIPFQTYPQGPNDIQLHPESNSSPIRRGHGQSGTSKKSKLAGEGSGIGKGENLWARPGAPVSMQFLWVSLVIYIFS